jgi:protein subunit release factor B
MMISKENLIKELEFRTSRSSGPGGQGVNKTETRVEAIWNIDRSNFFSTEQKDKIRIKLANRINQADELVVVASDHRSQLANKQLAINRIHSLIQDALKVHRPRLATKPTKGSKKRRREMKQQRSELKKNRTWRSI